MWLLMVITMYGTFFAHNGWQTDSMHNAAKQYVGDRTVLI